MTDRLHLHEELLLLGLHDVKGKLTSGMTTYAMAGGMLAELLLIGRIKVVPGKRPLVDVRSRERTGDRILDEVLRRIADAKRRAVLATWVSRAAGTKKLVRRAAERLCERGILREEDARVLLLFKTKRWPTRDAGPEHEIVERIERAITSTAHDADDRTVALVALAHHAGLLRAVFDRAWLKLHKRRIERLVDESAVGEATRHAIAAAQAAVIAAVTASTVVTT